MPGLLPDTLPFIPAALLIIASFFTSALTAAAGVGGGLLMLGIMTYVIPVLALIPVHGLVQLGSNTGRAWVQREHIDWRITLWFLLGAAFGAAAGIVLAIQLPTNILKILLAVFILLMVWIKFPGIPKAGPALIAGGGLVTTFASIFAGATGPLVAVFLNRIFDSHKPLVATHGATMTIQHGFKIIAFGLTGFAFWEWMPFVAAMIASGYAGTKTGSFILNKLPEKTLRMIFTIVLTLVALDLLRRGLAG